MRSSSLDSRCQLNRGKILYFGLDTLTPSADGYCSRTKRNTTDAEFIRYAVWGQTRLLKIPFDEDAVPEFLAKNPGCCMVYREQTTEVEKTSRLLWRRAVVVRLRNEERIAAILRGEAATGSDIYELVDNCLDGSEQLTEYLLGG